MTAKEYLNQVGKAEAHVQNLINELKALHEQAESTKGISFDGVKVQTFLNTDRMTDTIIKFQEKEERISEEIGRLIERRLNVVDEINALDDPRYITILYKHYVAIESWDEIATDLHYNTRYAQILHKEALAAFYEMYKEKHNFTGISTREGYHFYYAQK